MVRHFTTTYFSKHLHNYGYFPCLKKCIYFYFLRHVACRILVPQPEIKPGPPALETWSLNPQTAKAVLWTFSYIVIMP